jgi:hypothetical protein
MVSISIISIIRIYVTMSMRLYEALALGTKGTLMH